MSGSPTLANSMGSRAWPAGSFATQLTFAQSLTEFAAGVPGVLVVVSLPQSAIEVGGEAGEESLERLRNVVHRVQSPWRPASMAESFEIVRRRLFEDLRPESIPHRDAVVRAFSELYQRHAGEFPARCKEGDYRRQLEACYPIHPALFEHLYGRWSTLDKFQRTRGVLRLMAKVIHALWEAGDSSLMILPGMVPLVDSDVRSELLTYLDDPWGAVVESDIDGPDSLPVRIDRELPNLGRYGATRRVARTIFTGSAPTLASAHKGIEEADIKLGCTQPGENPAHFGDALRRLSDQANNIYQQQRRYWFSLQPSVSRLARDRAEQLDEHDVDEELMTRLRGELRRCREFAGVHLLRSSSSGLDEHPVPLVQDVPDEPEARLVILGPSFAHRPRDPESTALGAALRTLDQRAAGPRTHRNSLLFLAPDKTKLESLRQAVRLHEAWKSIVGEAERLNLDAYQRSQAETKVKEADEAVKLRISETYEWLLVPAQEAGGDITWSEVRVTGQGSLAEKAGKRAVADENLYTGMAGAVLRLHLDRVPLWGNGHVRLKDLWGYFSRYLYLPRLKDAQVLIDAVADGSSRLTWQQDGFAYADFYDEEHGRYAGLRAGRQGSISLELGCVVHPVEAARQLEEEEEAHGDAEVARGVRPAPGSEIDTGDVEPRSVAPSGPVLRYYYGRKTLDSERITRDAGDLADNIVRHLARLQGQKSRSSSRSTPKWGRASMTPRPGR